MYYKCYKISFKRRISYIDYPDWIKKEKVTINPNDEDDKCFQCAMSVALNHKEIKRDPQRISKINSFTNKYSWNGIKYLPKIDDCKTFEKNNPTVALNIMYIKEK